MNTRLLQMFFICLVGMPVLQLSAHDEVGSVDETIHTPHATPTVDENPEQPDTQSEQVKKTQDGSSNVRDKNVLPATAHLADTIKVVIYSEDGSDIITLSDIERPSLEGSFRSLDDVVLERLMYLDAKRFKMISDDDMIDKHLKAVQRENNLTLDQLKAIFKDAGYTYEEGRAQFGIMTSVSGLLDFKIRSRLVVPEKDIVAYYEAHPEIEPASFFIERVVVPVPADQDSKMVLENVEGIVSGKKDAQVLAWSAPFWINKGDIAPEKMFIVALKSGEISHPVEVAEGFELFRMVQRKEERPKPLQERYNEIAADLRKPRYELLMAEYRQQLFDAASIVYF